MSSEGGRDEKTPSAPGAGVSGALVVVNGWTLLFHPRLIDQVERLRDTARGERTKRPAGAPAGPNTKLLATLWDQLVREVPEDPSRSAYRQGNTLGPGFRHWQRVKFGNGRFRLFFRYHSKSRVIVYAWVNDSETLRTYGSRTEAYAVFRDMLNSGNPPDAWEELVRASASADVIRRARNLIGDPGDLLPTSNTI
ncbi:type II toxin-antitoxin system YhaV family toxin [Longimicrobium sp.]|uniref:type II toxin-antitoxin system YhaV family toxin n=1 Tax=Longimicrobium sp. TaxID=2029185 RepID=UPI003B3AB6C9